MIPSIPLWWHLGIFRWQDVVEIIIFVGCIRYLSAWLSQDTHKPLVLALYGYCSALLASHYLNLTTINSLLIIFTPVATAIFILLHQKTLQKNFITLHRITPSESISPHWIDTLTQAALTALSNNQPFTCIIEKKGALNSMFKTPYNVHMPFTQDLIRLIMSSNLYDPHALIWIDSHAKIQAFNCVWKKNSVDKWLASEVQEQEEWLQDALFFTHKTDALFIKLTPATRVFTVVIEGKIIEQTLAQQVNSTIKNYLNYSDTMKGDWYASSSRNSTPQQNSY